MATEIISENPDLNFTPYQALKIIELDHVADRFKRIDQILKARNGKPFTWNNLEIGPQFAYGLYSIRRGLVADLEQENMEDAAFEILRSHAY